MIDNDAELLKMNSGQMKIRLQTSHVVKSLYFFLFRKKICES